MITMNEFFSLPEVIEYQRQQKTAKRFGDTQHRNAHIAILELAKKHKVEKYFETLADYDKAIA